MTNNTRKPNSKKLIIGLCAGAAAVIAIVVIVVVVLLNHSGAVLNDNYFVSDGSKYVLNLEAEDISFADVAYEPVKAHLVYTYSGDKITGVKTYYEYSDNESAVAAANYLKEEYIDDENAIEVKDKYVIYISPESDYEDVTASDIKQQIDFLEALKNADQDEDVDEADITE